MDCTGCRYLDEEAGPDGVLFCAHPLYARMIEDAALPPCEGDGFVARFPSDQEFEL